VRLVKLLLDAAGPICGLQLGAILKDKADDGGNQKGDGQKALPQRTGGNGDDSADGHGREESRTGTEDETRDDEDEKVEADGGTSDTLPGRKRTLGSQLESAMVWRGDWLV
jgi:hypothetical protein